MRHAGRKVTSEFEGNYYLELAAAFCRGRLGLNQTVASLDAVERGKAAGLRLHKFKRTSTLPRIERVIGLLKGLAPRTLLDIGSGRGAFLWPLLDALPDLNVTTMEVSAQRLLDLRAVSAGGVPRLSVVEHDLAQPVDDLETFDVVTALEVLEHIPDVEAATRNLVKLTERAVVVSVPTKPDENPEHLRLFTEASLTAMLLGSGVFKVQTSYVRGHLIAVGFIS